jgi:hypothetical protein
LHCTKVSPTGRFRGAFLHRTGKFIFVNEIKEKLLEKHEMVSSLSSLQLKFRFLGA